MKEFVRKTKPENCIEDAQAMKMREHWNATRAQAIEQALGFTDSADFVWSLEALEEYIAYVKAQSKAQGIENPGIRANFAAYPDTNRASLFFSATVSPDGNADNNYNIEAFNIGGQGHPPVDFGD